MADEINRASPKTQSALLQAMQEHHVTVAGQRHDVPAPFHVLATQNPLEQEGTYPLPEAQLDRFLLQVDVGYPDQGAERRMLFATTGTDERRVEPILTAQELMGIQRLVRQLPVPDKVVEAILKLARSARPGTGVGGETDRLIAWGPGPRASQALMLAVRAKALIDGRLAPSVDDVDRAGRARAQAPHGADLRSARRRRDGDERHQSFGSSAGVISGWRREAPRQARPTDRTTDRARPARRASSRSRAKRKALADRLPDLLLEALRVANAVAHGIHGRRRPGSGETFWQFRQFNQASDRGHHHRLAALGQLRPSLRARARMGGGAHLLALAGRIALDGLPQSSGADHQARPRRRADAGLRRAAGAGR